MAGDGIYVNRSAEFVGLGWLASGTMTAVVPRGPVPSVVSSVPPFTVCALGINLRTAFSFSTSGAVYRATAKAHRRLSGPRLRSPCFNDEASTGVTGNRGVCVTTSALLREDRPSGANALCYSRKMRRGLPIVVIGLALTAASCGGSPAVDRPQTTTTVPLPAGRFPSEVSKMVCQPKAQSELAVVLGIRAVVQTPTWVGHLYTCRYQYPAGAMVLSVKELSSWGQTKGYFAMLGRQLGDTGPLGNLGQGAFTTTDGSVVVRKDWKVLLVDISGLPDQFGVPLTAKGDIADTVSDVILGCWAGD